VARHLRPVERSDDEPSEEEIVAAWWRRSALLHGARRDPDVAAALDWAAQAVSDVLDLAPVEDAVAMLDNLLAADAADPAVVGCGPLERLLDERGPEADERVAGLCASDPAWRAAVAAAGLSEGAASSLPRLAPYLS
jgi:hypothetical protein